jgi:hypothetical protein
VEQQQGTLLIHYQKMPIVYGIQPKAAKAAAGYLTSISKKPIAYGIQPKAAKAAAGYPGLALISKKCMIN